MSDGTPCPSCRFVNRAGARFCAECGGILARVCSSCGAEVEAGWRFCDACGAPLGGSEGRTPTPASVDAPPAHLKPAEPKSVSDAERRQLTVVFCDLVDSTPLSRQLDPEDMREVLGRYQDVVAGHIARYDGYLARFLGDGVLAYFGWPQAYEDQVERAVRTSLEVVTAVAAIPSGHGHLLQARVGIATGLVVVGELIGASGRNEETVTGETPNLAARLQAVAKPGQVVIDANTRRLIGDFFVLDELGPQTLKGFTDHPLAWRVAAASTVESRFDAAHSGALTPFAGREHDLGLMTERWVLAKDGEGQVLLLSGEAGIGKSRMLQAFREQLGDEPHFRLRYQCSSHHVNTVLYPIVQRLERAAKFSAADTAEDKLVKLEALLGLSGQNIDVIAPLFASLLSLPGEARYGGLQMSAQEQRDQTIEALIGQVLALSQRRPVLFILEDAHWIDPTTQALVGETLARISNSCVFMIITHRSDFQPPWAGHPHVTVHSLNRLGRRDCAAIVGHLTNAKALPNEVLDQIIAKTDGVPLFVEELTRTVLESGLVTEQQDRYALDGPLPQLAIPTSLQDSLMARLDRLAPAKEVAQIGAALGREFADELLSTVAGMDRERLDSGLEALLGADLIFRRKTGTGTKYVFKHALVQDAAYESMLQSTRRRLHARIVHVLQACPAGDAAAQPEILAYHSSMAELRLEAAGYRLQAARGALQRSALQEAKQNLAQGLAALGTNSDDDARAQLELELQTTLGIVLRSLQGPSHADTEAAFQRAYELCSRFSSTADQFLPTVGLFTARWSQGRVDQAQSFADRLRELADRDADADRQFVAHCACGMVAWHAGDNRKAVRDLETALAIGDRSPGAVLGFNFGTDFEVLAQRYMGFAWLSLGAFDRAIASAREIVSAGKSSKAAVSRCLSLASGVHMAVLLRDHDANLEWAEECIALATTYEFPTWRYFAAISRGWSLAHRCRVREGIGEMLSAVEQWRRRGNPVWWPMVWNMLAEAHLLDRAPEEALRLADLQQAEIERTGGRQIEAMALITRGSALLLKDGGDSSAAERQFLKAAEVARRQGAKAWELRAAIHLARLRLTQGRPREANELLGSVLASFCDQNATGDLNEAHALLRSIA
jgi:class 3 adenylate cyclase/predicted ATPase